MNTLINGFILTLYMPSSVTVPDELRRRIKQLAAFFDTSQAEVIERAIAEYEQFHMPKEDITKPELVAYLARISKEVHSKDPARKRRFEKLSGPGVTIEAVSPALWGRSPDE
jgi:predicted transcriptional regulator